MDMSKTHADAGAQSTPMLENGRISTGAGGKSGGSFFSLMKFHGLSAGVAMILFPIGVYFLRSPSSKAGFSRHWMIQLSGVALVMFTIISGLYHSLFVHRHFASLHQWLGLAFAAAFPAQVYVGVLHHRYYIVHRSRSRVSHVHIWLGRIAMLSGVLNVFL